MINDHIISNVACLACTRDEHGRPVALVLSDGTMYPRAMISRQSTVRGTDDVGDLRLLRWYADAHGLTAGEEAGRTTTP